MATPRGGHSLPELVSQDEGRLILAIQIAAQGQGALALYLVAEDRNRHEVLAKGHLMRGEQGAGGKREILTASLAPEAQGAIGAPGLVNRGAAAMGAERFAVSLGPADRGKDNLNRLIAHPRNSADAERPGFRRKEEVLGHLPIVSAAFLANMIG